MIRRPIGLAARAVRWQPRLLGAAILLAGIFAAGQRAGKESARAAAEAELDRRLAALADLRSAGALTDEDYATARKRLLAD